MKLRLHKGSLRLRLSQGEVVQLAQNGRVDDAATFAPDCELTYSIESSDAAPFIQAVLDGPNIRVVVPIKTATQWTQSDEVGMEGSTGSLSILIEKDFQCLHRPPEPGEDSFPNPLETKSSGR